MDGNTTSSHIPTTPPVPGIETFLESFIPGFSLISKLFFSYYGIDVSAYLTSILLLVAGAAGVRYAWAFAWDLVRDYCTATAEIRLDDEMYNYLMFWVSLQGFSKNTHRFVAGTSTSSELVDASDDEDSDAEDDDDKDENWSFDDGSEDNFWEWMIHREKFKSLRYTPSNGRHYFWFRGRILAFTREKDEKGSRSWVSNSESLYVSCLGRNPAILKELLKEAQKAYVERDGHKTVIYRCRKGIGGGDHLFWARCMARHQRPLSTVVLDAEQKQAFVDDVKEYLHPLTRRWYSNRGIPYRRGYLLHGPPGTGKTSLCFASAGLFGLKIYVVSLSSGNVTEDGLASLFQRLPRRCIVLLEDIDAAGITQKRAAQPPVETESTLESNEDGSKGPPSHVPNDVAASGSVGISLSALLNIIDGVASNEGRILIMTTNHPEKLDDALLRPGRVDMSIAFKCADKATMTELFRALYTAMEGDFPQAPGTPNSIPNGINSDEKESRQSLPSGGSTKVSKPANGTSSTSNILSSKFRLHRHEYSDSEIASRAVEFASKIPENTFTPAEIQGYLLKYKTDPDAAIERVSDWVGARLKEKDKKSE